ncbi:MAG: phosphoribosylanthranilate isomerase [Acidobacteria bacterium]|nr:phosphoribosylanthranilate isomerase [Acidobacteriota bacterium]
MEPTRRPRVKICCIASIEEAALAIRYGASALGLVSDMPSGPGPIPEERIRDIAATIPPGVSRFLLTCKTDAAEVIDQQRRLGVDTVQLCDRLVKGAYADLRKGMPGIRIVQVIHITGSESVTEAAAAAQHVDALLLDSGNPHSPVKELGGTGRIHDWVISRKIRETVHIPIFLAGGLNARNITEAMQRVRPYGIDVCSGLRTSGRLDERLLDAFFEAINRTN